MFPDSVVCYHLFDDLARYGGESSAKVEAALDRIFSRADLVFASSEQLAERYRRWGNVHWIPNGVDYELYASGAPAVPSDLERVPGIRLGYAGTIRAQIDIDLLTSIAAAKPEWSMVLIGDASRSAAESAPFRALRSLPNVHWLGPKEMHLMPAYLSHLHVGLLPYRLDGAAQFCYPLKMHEYLAAGLPVVSSNISAVRTFSSVVRVAHTLPEWIASIEESVRRNDAALVAERRQIASENSWDTRVSRISSLIAAAIESRRSQGIEAAAR